MLYIVHFTAFCLGGPFFSSHGVVTVTILLTVCEIFSRVEVENHHFPPLCCDCGPPCRGIPSNMNIIYASLKSTYVGYNFVTDNMGLHLFSCCDLCCYLPNL